MFRTPLGRIFVPPCQGGGSRLVVRSIVVSHLSLGERVGGVDLGGIRGWACLKRVNASSMYPGMEMRTSCFL